MLGYITAIVSYKKTGFKFAWGEIPKDTNFTSSTTEKSLLRIFNHFVMTHH